MYIIIISILLVFLVLTIKKSKYRYEYFIISQNCGNADIFKAINQVSNDINEFKYSSKKILENREKYNDMYRWYLNQRGINNSVPLCDRKNKLDQKKENAAMGKSIKGMFKKAKTTKPATKAAAKNRNIVANALNKNMNKSSDEKIRQEWIDMTSNEMVKNISDTCPRSTKDWGYNLLEKCSNGKTTYNESEKEDKNKLEKILDDDITRKRCLRMKNKCLDIINRAREKATNESYNYGINELRQSVKNNKEKAMNKDVKNQDIPSKFF